MDNKLFEKSKLEPNNKMYLYIDGSYYVRNKDVKADRKELISKLKELDIVKGKQYTTQTFANIFDDNIIKARIFVAFLCCLINKYGFVFKLTQCNNTTLVVYNGDSLDDVKEYFEENIEIEENKISMDDIKSKLDQQTGNEAQNLETEIKTDITLNTEAPVVLENKIEEEITNTNESEIKTVVLENKIEEEITNTDTVIEAPVVLEKSEEELLSNSVATDAINNDIKKTENKKPNNKK